jgi:hypothetical protein
MGAGRENVRRQRALTLFFTSPLAGREPDVGAFDWE